MSQKNSLHVNTPLRKERLLREWSQQDLANHLGTTVVTVNRWERGIQQPGPMFRLKLCRLYGKSEEELGLSSKGTALASASSEMLEQQEALTAPPCAERRDVLPQKLDLPPAHLLDHAPLCEETDTACASLSSELANTSSRHVPAFQTLPLGKEPAHEPHPSLIQAIHISRKNRLSFLFLLSTLSVLLLVGAMLLTSWPASLFSRQTHSAPHTTPSVPSPASGRLLYQAPWSKDNGGWAASTHWHWSDQNGGMIATDSGTNSLMFAPYQLSTSAYAIEASIQRLSYTNMDGTAYGVVVGRTPDKGEVCGVGIHEKPEHFFISQLTPPTTQSQPHVDIDLLRSPVTMNTQWHTYRVEVTANHIRYFLDSKFIGQVNNDNHIQGGQVGIYAVGVFINIKSFSIFAL